MQRRLIQVDKDTGEVVEGVTAVFFNKRKSGFGRKFMLMSQLALIEISKRRADLGLEAISAFLAMAGYCDFENSIPIAQSEVARELGMTPSNFHRAIKKLVSAGLLIETKQPGRRREFKLSPMVAWKGNGGAHILSMADHLKKQSV